MLWGVGLVPGFQTRSREPSTWSGAEDFCSIREWDKLKSTAQKKCTESSRLGQTRVKLATEQQTPKGKIKRSSHRWTRRSRASGHALEVRRAGARCVSLPCGGLVRRGWGDRAQIKPRLCRSVAERPSIHVGPNSWGRRWHGAE